MNNIKEIRIRIFDSNYSPEPVPVGHRLLEFNISAEPSQRFVYRTHLPPNDFQSYFDRIMDEIKYRVEQALKDANYEHSNNRTNQERIR